MFNGKSHIVFLLTKALNSCNTTILLTNGKDRNKGVNQQICTYNIT